MCVQFTWVSTSPMCFSVTIIIIVSMITIDKLMGAKNMLLKWKLKVFKNSPSPSNQVNKGTKK